MPHSIWSCLEIDIVCRDLHYQDYLFWHKKLEMKSKPISEDALKRLAEWFTSCMEEDIKKEENN